MAQDLVALISASVALHDPLDPWLVQSNYDEHYWDEVAARAVSEVEASRSEAEVNQALMRGLSQLVDLTQADGYARDRIAAAAAEIWKRLRS